MLGQEPVEERRVAVLERGQADVPLEVVVLAPEVLELEVDLLLDREDAVRQEAAQAEGVALLLAEREVLGEQASAEERPSRSPRPRWIRLGSSGRRGAAAGASRQA